MLSLYSGTPGSGKSLHLARTIRTWLAVHKSTVICNFPINTDIISKNGKKKIGEFIYRPNDNLTVKFLVDYAMEHHKAGVEGQSLIVIDEAGIMFNSRDYGSSDRKEWLWFMSLHRHFGYNVIIASQQDRMIDRQMRGFIETNYIHRKANNFRFIGFLFTILRIPLFVVVEQWYPVRLRNGTEVFMYHKRDGKLYDTMMLMSSGQYGGMIAGPSADAGGRNGGSSVARGGPIATDSGGSTGAAFNRDLLYQGEWWKETEIEPPEVGS
jgi:hypothetical protein